MGWKAWEEVSGFDFTDIIYEKKCHTDGGCISRITINRPKVLNAFTGHTIEEMSIALHDTSHDQMVGAVVLTGAGDKAFCTGGDVKWEADGGVRPLIEVGAPGPNDFVRCCKKIVIAAVKGWAIGGGNHLAYCCDFTIAADNARFGQNGPRVGSPADTWVVSYLTRVVGAKKAREMWMLARRYNAQQALDMGLVNTVVPLDKLDDEVDKWCEELLSLSPTCLSILKTTFDAEIDYMRSSRWSALMAPDFYDSPECKEAQQAFFEKRKPDFWQFRE